MKHYRPVKNPSTMIFYVMLDMPCERTPHVAKAPIRKGNLSLVINR